MAWRKKYEPNPKENTLGRVASSKSHAREYGLSYNKAQKDYCTVMATSKAKESNGTHK